jgi:hypothetical protein
MCGILGIIAQSSNIHYLKKMLPLSDHGGQDNEGLLLRL